MFGNRSLVSFLPSRSIIMVATLFGLGFKTKAPGTLGSLAGILVQYLVYIHLSPALYFILAGLVIYIAIQFCGEAEVRMHKQDPGEVILDEFAVIPLCFTGLLTELTYDRTWGILALGFLLFRFFDIFKPLGIKKLENLHGGIGIVADDVLAAIYTCLTLHLLFWMFPILL